jgi:O-antigen/teichoic acid export membrane protein
MLMTSIFSYLSCEAGTIILGMYRTASEAGYFSMAAKIATLTSFILTAINTVAGPKYSELYHGNKLDDLFHVAAKSAQLIFWTTTPILFGLLLLGHPILTLLFGSAFAVAYAPLAILILGQFVNAVSGSTGLFMNMTDNHTALVRIMAVAALANIVLNVLLIPGHGIVGAALAATASISLWNVSILIFIRLKYNRTICYVPLLAADQRSGGKG